MENKEKITNKLESIMEILKNIIKEFPYNSTYKRPNKKHKKIDVELLQKNLCEFLSNKIPELTWDIEHKITEERKDAIDIYGEDNNRKLCVVIELDAHRADQVAKKFLSRSSLLLDKNLIYISLCYEGTKNENSNECKKYFEYCEKISKYMTKHTPSTILFFGEILLIKK
jgi:nitrate reductase NapAB chaperone NapD